MPVWVIVANPENVEGLVHWGSIFARARSSSLRLIAVEEGEALVREVEVTEQAATGPHPLLWPLKQAALGLTGLEVAVEHVRDPNIVEKLVAHTAGGPGLLVLAKQVRASEDEPESLWARRLFRRVECRTLLLRLGSVPTEPVRMLVPAAGGPHAMEALALGSALVRQCDFELTPLFVERHEDPLALDVGTKILRKVTERAGLANDDRIRPQVVVSKDVQGGIARAAEQGFDLIVIGESRRESARKWLFGTLPGRLAKSEDAPAVGVIRRPQPMRERLAERLTHVLARLVPQLEREERVELFEKLESNSRWNFDFTTLITLATAIAALGLVQDSAAVVIGAMLVAPLMTPILAGGLAVVQGNALLLRSALKAVALGFLSALAVGALVGWCAQPEALTAQLQGRAKPPGLLDVWVGLLSGVAAAYCLGRRGLSAALPGVAIAAALVPPIATTGICLTMNEPDGAGNSALLFGTNVVAIVYGAALCFFLTGVRAHRGRSYYSIILALGALTIGIGLWFVSRG